jgi:hypothetical protein
MIATLAVATHTMPSAWLAEEDEMIITVVAILQDQAEAAARKAGARARR